MSGEVARSGETGRIVAQLKRRDDYPEAQKKAKIEEEAKEIKKWKRSQLCEACQRGCYVDNLAQKMLDVAHLLAEKVEKEEEISPEKTAGLIMEKIKEEMDPKAKNVEYSENLKLLKLSESEVRSLLNNFGSFLKGKNAACIKEQSDLVGRADKLDVIKRIGTIINPETVEIYVKKVEVHLLEMVAKYNPQAPKK